MFRRTIRHILMLCAVFCLTFTVFTVRSEAQSLYDAMGSYSGDPAVIVEDMSDSDWIQGYTELYEDYSFKPAAGDEITFTYEGVEQTYVCEYTDDDYQFVCGDDKLDFFRIQPNYLDPSKIYLLMGRQYYDEEDEETYYDITVAVLFDIDKIKYENSVESIEFTPSEIELDRKALYEEYADDPEWEFSFYERCRHEYNGKTWYSSYAPGDKVTVTYANGDKKEFVNTDITYDYYDEDEDETYTRTRDLFINGKEYFYLSYNNLDGYELKTGNNRIGLFWHGVSTTINVKVVCDHEYGSWDVTPATELAAGKKVRSCKYCGKTETQTIKKLSPSLKAVNILKPKAAKKAMTVRWKKLSKKDLKKTAKIQIQYSTDKKFKSGVKTKYAGAKKTSLKIKNLKSKKKYYVRIRAYTKKGGTVHVSKWSAVKSVKVK